MGRFRVNAAPPTLLLALLVAACSGKGGPTAIEIPIARIQITKACPIVIEGEQCQIGAVAFTEDDQRIENPVLRYLSSTAAAEVTTRGVVIGRAPGSGTIFVTNSTGSVSRQFDVAVLARGAPK